MNEDYTKYLIYLSELLEVDQGAKAKLTEVRDRLKLAQREHKTKTSEALGVSNKTQLEQLKLVRSLEIPEAQLYQAWTAEPEIRGSYPSSLEISKVTTEIGRLNSFLGQSRLVLANLEATKGVADRVKSAMRSDRKMLLGVLGASLAFTGFINFARLSGIFSADIFNLTFHLGIWAGVLFLILRNRESFIMRTSWAPQPTKDGAYLDLHQRVERWVGKAMYTDKSLPLFLFSGLSLIMVGMSWPLGRDNAYNPDSPVLFALAILVGIGLLLLASRKHLHGYQARKEVKAWLKLHHPRRDGFGVALIDYSNYPPILRAFPDRSEQKSSRKVSFKK